MKINFITNVYIRTKEFKAQFASHIHTNSVANCWRIEVNVHQFHYHNE